MKPVFLCVILLLAVAGCPKPDAGPRLSLEPPEWAEGEISQYTVVIADDTIGQHIIQVHRTEYEGVPALEFVVETLANIEGLETHDSAWTVVRLDGLRPIRSVRNVANSEFAVMVDVRYTRETAMVTAMTPVGPETAEIPLEPNDFDNDQLVQLVRALPLEPDKPLELDIVVGMAGTRTEARASLVGAETITVPAGTFDCRRVRLTLAGQDADIWYEAEGLRRMVRYEAPVAELVIELVAGIII